MEYLRKIRNTLVLTAVTYIALGLVMLLIPLQVSDFICYIIGSLFFVVGMIGIFSFVKLKGVGFLSSFMLVISIIFAALGIYIFCNPASFSTFIPLVAGIMLILDSVNKFQVSMELKKTKNKKWLQMLILSMIVILCGILLIFNPFEAIELFIRIIGGLLIFNGLSNLFTIYCYSKTI